MSAYWDRDGRPITEAAYVDLATIPEYRTVAHTEIPRADSDVTTEWTGLNYDYRYPAIINAPVIFQTVVRGGGLSGSSRGAATEAEALRYHEDRVEAVRSEQGSFTVLRDDPDVAAAVAFLQGRLDEHMDAYGSSGDTSVLYDRLVRALIAQAAS